MRAYLEAAALWPGVARALAEGRRGPAGRPPTAAEFVETLLRKCQGVWIYLHYVVSEIDQGTRSPLDLEALPNSVWQYYAERWRKWRDRDKTAWYG